MADKLALLPAGTSGVQAPVTASPTVAPTLVRVAASSEDQVAKLVNALQGVPDVYCAMQRSGVVPKDNSMWPTPYTRDQQPYRFTPTPGKSADAKVVNTIDERLRSAFHLPPGPGPLPGLPAVRPELLQVRAAQALHELTPVLFRAERDGTLDDLVAKMKSNGTLGLLAEASKYVPEAANTRLAEVFARGLDGHSLGEVFTELEAHRSPLSMVDGEGRAPLATAIGSHSSPAAKSDFVGELATNSNLAASKDARLAVATALSALDDKDAKKAWSYLSSEQLKAFGGEAVQSATDWRSRIWDAATSYVSSSPTGDPALASALLRSAMAKGDPETKAVAFEAAANVLHSLGGADKNRLLTEMTDLLRSDIKGITQRLRARPDVGKAVVEYSKAMIEPALGGFYRRGAQLHEHPNIKALGEIIEVLAGDPKNNPGSMVDYLNARDCVRSGSKPQTATDAASFENAKDLFFWLGASKRAANDLAQQWKISVTADALTVAGGISVAKDAASAFASKPWTKIKIGGGAAGLALIVAFEARDYYRNVRSDAMEAAAWLRYLSSPDSGVAEQALQQGERIFNEVSIHRRFDP